MSNVEKLTNVFTETFGISVGQTIGLEYQGIEAWDSVGHMTLVAAIEDSFDVMLDTDDIIDMSSFEKAQTILKKYDVEF